MKNKETLEKAAKNYAIDNSLIGYELMPYKGFIAGAKWQQKQEQNNENSWFNEYQEVENYIIKRIGDKFLEATPDKYKTASEATISLLESNWQKENMYSEEDMINFTEWVIINYQNQYKLLTTSDKRGFYTTKELLIEWFEQFKKK